MGEPVKIRIIDYLSYLFKGIYYPATWQRIAATYIISWRVR
jgi:hypothetical protein